MKVEDKLQERYNKYYDNDISEWRLLGAIDKANNIIELTNKKYNKIIEVGAGDGSILSILSKKKIANKYYAVEISDSAIDFLENRDIESLIEVKKFDGYKIPYPDNYFDLAILAHVLEHVEFPRTILRELKRISKQQIIEVPRDYSFGVDKKYKELISYGHINIYTPTLLNFLLKSENFKILKNKKAFYSKEIIKFSWYGNNKKISFFKNMKLCIYLILRRIAYFLFSASRKETMINSYTVLTE